MNLLIFVLIPLTLLLVAGSAVGLFFLIRYFIRYNAQQKSNKTLQQDEMDKMNIEDL